MNMISYECMFFFSASTERNFWFAKWAARNRRSSSPNGWKTQEIVSPARGKCPRESTKCCKTCSWNGQQILIFLPPCSWFLYLLMFATYLYVMRTSGNSLTNDRMPRRLEWALYRQSPPKCADKHANSKGAFIAWGTRRSLIRPWRFVFAVEFHWFRCQHINRYYRHLVLWQGDVSLAEELYHHVTKLDNELARVSKEQNSFCVSSRSYVSFCIRCNCDFLLLICVFAKSDAKGERPRTICAMRSREDGQKYGDCVQTVTSECTALKQWAHSNFPTVNLTMLWEFACEGVISRTKETKRWIGGLNHSPTCRSEGNQSV